METINISEFSGTRNPKDRCDFNDPRLVAVTRIRLLSDAHCPFWDVSYVWGILNDGTPVRITPPATWFQIPRRRTAAFLIRTWPDLPNLCPDRFVRNVLSLCD